MLEEIVKTKGYKAALLNQLDPACECIIEDMYQYSVQWGKPSDLKPYWKIGCDVCSSDKLYHGCPYNTQNINDLP